MTSNKQVKITVREIGHGFACDAAVKRGRKVLHVTRDYPHGQRANAYAAAEAWALDHGFAVAAA